MSISLNTTSFGLENILGEKSHSNFDDSTLTRSHTHTPSPSTPPPRNMAETPNLKQIHDDLVALALEAGQMILAADPSSIPIDSKMNCPPPLPPYPSLITNPPSRGPRNRHRPRRRNPRLLPPLHPLPLLRLRRRRNLHPRHHAHHRCAHLCRRPHRRHPQLHPRKPPFPHPPKPAH